MTNDPSDKIFDYLTSEMLEGPEPPDLSGQIVEAWRREQKSAKVEDAANSAVAHTLACDRKDLTGVDSTATDPIDVPIPPPVSPRIKSADPLDVRKPASGNVRRRWVAFATSAVALTGLFALLSQFLPNPNGGMPNSQEGLAKQTDIGSEGQLADGSTSPEQDFHSKPAAPAETAVAADDPEGKGNRAERLNLDDLPFDLGEKEAVVSSEAPEAIPGVAKLTSQEIVAKVDEAFEKTWTDLGVTALPALEGRALAERVFAGLTARQPGENLRFDQVDQRRLVELLLRQPDFARHWASATMKSWGVNRSLRGFQDDAAVADRVIQRRIAQGADWNAFVGEVLATDVAASEWNDDRRAGRFVLASLSQGGSHRMLDRIGGSFLNTNLSCSRCHDAKVSRDVASDSEVGKQRGYWSLIALFNGFRLAPVDQGTRSLQDTQPELFGKGDPKVFFDALDGRVFAADATLPDNSPWASAGAKTPRLAFAKWLKNSTVLDESVVNATWKQLLGRHLVPQVEAVDLVALNHRRRVLQLLAEQYRAHGHNLKSLVGWIASTRVFALPQNDLSEEQWLAADSASLALLQLQSLVSPRLRRLEQPRTVVTWPVR